MGFPVVTVILDYSPVLPVLTKRKNKRKISAIAMAKTIKAWV